MVNIIWALLDLAIVYTYFRFGRRELPEFVTRDVRRDVCGTLVPAILFGVYESSPFILALGILCSVFDIAYIGLLMWARRQPSTLEKAAPRAQKVIGYGS